MHDSVIWLEVDAWCHMVHVTLPKSQCLQTLLLLAWHLV
jgi:hypothetical protein